MTSLPDDGIFHIRSSVVDDDDDDSADNGRLVPEMSDEWTLEELHRAMVNNEFQALHLGTRIVTCSRPDVIDAVVDGLRQNTSIEEFQFHNEENEFTDETMLAILGAVSTLPRLRYFSCWYTQWSNEVSRVLGDLVSSSSTLITYAMGVYQKFRSRPSIEEEVERDETTELLLLNSVRANGTIEKLWVYLPLSPGGLANLFDAIVTAGSVRVLHFSDNGGHGYLENLPETVSLLEHNTVETCANSRLERIDFGTDEKIPNDKAAEALCMLAKLHSHLVHVDLEMMTVPDPKVCFYLDWNRIGRPLLCTDTPMNHDTVFEALEEVNNPPRAADDEDGDSADSRPEMYSTSITYKILQEVCLPNNYFGGGTTKE